MKKKAFWIAGLLVLVFGAWAFVSRRGAGDEEVSYRYEEVKKDTLIRSIEATGVLVAKTSVDVKSKAGGKVVQLVVDAGSAVKKGDLIAIIDPSDTRATVEQAQADLQSASARAEQAASNYQLQIASSRNAVADARLAVQQAQTRLERARLQGKRQPALTNAAVRSADAAFQAAVAAQNRLEQVTIPQMQRDSQANLRKAQSDLDTAEAELKRQEDLLARGFVAVASVERARSSLENARANFASTQQRSQTLDHELDALRRSQATEVERARASLAQAKANSSEVDVSATQVQEAEEAVRQAEINLQKAVDNQIQNDIRREDMIAARASTVRSRVSLANAQVQLDSTTVVAPRDGVVTQKYLEEGTIIPPGTSTFSQGTSLVQISDTTEMFVECAVDEADIASVRDGQQVRITAEAFPGEKFPGIVDRVNPAATTEQNVTAIKVRVRVLPGYKLNLRPGMNATAEFITLSKPNVLLVPGQAIERGQGGKSIVKVKGADETKPISREVEIGEEGNSGVEVLKGLKAGEEVVVATINVAELKEVQKRMIEAQQGGGLAGNPMGGRRTTSGNQGGRNNRSGQTAGGAGMGGGSMGGGSMGGGARSGGAGGGR